MMATQRERTGSALHFPLAFFVVICPSRIHRCLRKSFRSSDSGNKSELVGREKNFRWIPTWELVVMRKQREQRNHNNNVHNFGFACYEPRPDLRCQMFECLCVEIYDRELLDALLIDRSLMQQMTNQMLEPPKSNTSSTYVSSFQ